MLVNLSASKPIKIYNTSMSVEFRTHSEPVQKQLKTDSASHMVWFKLQVSFKILSKVVAFKPDKLNNVSKELSLDK